jgi:hypothetical protein
MFTPGISMLSSTALSAGPCCSFTSTSLPKHLYSSGGLWCDGHRIQIVVAGLCCLRLPRFSSKIHSHGGSCFIRFIHGDIVCSGLLTVVHDPSTGFLYLNWFFPLLDAGTSTVDLVRAAVALVRTSRKRCTVPVCYCRFGSIGLKPDSQIQRIRALL